MPKLMIPGPVEVEDDVLHEMGEPVRAHYGKEWTAAYNETREQLKQVFKTEADIHILAGSGSAGLDAAIGSLTAAGETAIVGVNGFFGNRLAEICESYGLDVATVEAPAGESLEASEFETRLAETPEAAIVAVVHLETSTSAVNPIEEIAAITRARRVPVMVDAVAGLGGVPLEMDDWGIDICVSASQKCLGAPPGLAPIAVGPGAWSVMEAKPTRNHGWYLNLQTWRRYAEDWGAWHPHPVTLPTNNMYALQVGLSSLLKDGLEARISRYTSLAKRLRSGLRELNLEPFTPDERLAPVLTAVYAPQGVNSNRIVRYLLEEHGIKISGGLGKGLSERTFRVGHMGPKVSESDIDEVLVGLSEFLQSQWAAA